MKKIKIKSNKFCKNKIKKHMAIKSMLIMKFYHPLFQTPFKI